MALFETPASPFYTVRSPGSITHIRSHGHGQKKRRKGQGALYVHCPTKGCDAMFFPLPRLVHPRIVCFAAFYICMYFSCWLNSTAVLEGSESGTFMHEDLGGSYRKTLFAQQVGGEWGLLLSSPSPGCRVFLPGRLTSVERAIYLVC